MTDKLAELFDEREMKRSARTASQNGTQPKGFPSKGPVRGAAKGSSAAAAKPLSTRRVQ
jgi:hypothetical protein